MSTQFYGIRTTINASYEDAIPKVTDALKQEGFGILTQIDVAATLKQKLDKSFRKYVILGACNPSLAYQALMSETEIGLFLPCNVLVYAGDDGKTVVITGAGGYIGSALTNKLIKYSSKIILFGTTTHV